MPNTLHSSSEVPDFSTYPEEPLAQAPGLEATYRTYRRYSEPEENPLLEPARRLGARLGSAFAGMRDRMSDLGSRSRGQSKEMTRRIGRMADEKPMQFLMGMAIAGLIAGVGIRVWRDHE
jgi:hypothetical protein